jgi:multicomponent K+:H+ antiporter subunit A
MMGGTTWVEARTHINPPYWIAIGLLVAGAAGMSAWIAGRTFLTSTAGSFHLPLIGEVHLATTLLFDVGVYMLVAGSAVLMLIALAHQSLRSRSRVPQSQKGEAGELRPDEAEMHGAGAER